MTIKKGTHRTVIITKYLTIKLPRVFNPFSFLKRAVARWNRKGDMEVAILDLQNLFIRIPIKGFKENWNEFMCWRDNKADFLMPVYFCLGIIEIQKTSCLREISEAEIDKIWVSLIMLAKQEVWDTDHHHLGSAANYHKEDNRFKLIDYGGQGMRQFIKKYRQELEEIFSSKT